MNNSETFESGFIDFCRRNSLMNKGETVLLAYSGGIDSSVLLHLLNNSKDELRIALVICYFNHNLRGAESAREEEFVKNTAAYCKLSLEVGTGDVETTAEKRGLSTQESARRLRYDFFERASKKFHADKIATGHHLDDQAETVLMRFLQGSGIKGLRGIPLQRQRYVRPLLWAKRSEIEQYAVAKGIHYFEDSSNKKTAYLRNQIRLEVLPYLREKLGTNIDLILVKHGRRFRSVSEMISDLSNQAFDRSIVQQGKDKIILDITSFKSYFMLVQDSVVCECFRRLGLHDSLRITHYSQKVLEFLNGTFKRKHMYITKDLYVHKNKDSLTISREHVHKFVQCVDLGKEYSFPEEKFRFHSEIIQPASSKQPVSLVDIKKRSSWDEVVDRGALVEPLTLRNWEAGDRFKPLGMQKSKKLSDFFIDLKIPPDVKKKLPILVDPEKIVWVCGIRIDDRVKVTKNTKEIVGLKYTDIH